MGVLGQSIETPIIHVFASPDTSSLRHSVTPLILPLHHSDSPILRPLISRSCISLLYSAWLTL